MPVIGLSDQLRLPRLGKIRLGEKQISKKTGREHPVALDYFVIPEEVKQFYEAKPRKLHVMLPMEDKEVFFPQWFKRYGSSKGLICKGDGEQATEINEETGEMIEIECSGKGCQYFQDLSCKTVGNLQVVLHKVPGLGVYQIDTSSYNSILNLNSSIEMIRGMLGRISWIPLILKVEMCEAHPRVNNKPIKTIVPVMTLTADVSVEEVIKKATEMIPKATRLIPLEGAPGTPKVEIENPEVDEKEELLFPDKDGNLEPEEKEEIQPHEGKVKLGKEATDEEPAKEEPTVSISDGKEILKQAPTQEEGKLFPNEKEEPTEEEPAHSDHNIAINRNRLNIIWHKIKKRLMSADIWNDDKYRAWLNVQFGVNSSKELDGEQMTQGIEIMGQLWNDQLDKEK